MESKEEWIKPIMTILTAAEVNEKPFLTARMNIEIHGGALSSQHSLSVN